MADLPKDENFGKFGLFIFIIPVRISYEMGFPRDANVKLPGVLITFGALLIYPLQKVIHVSLSKGVIQLNGTK